MVALSRARELARLIHQQAMDARGYNYNGDGHCDGRRMSTATQLGVDLNRLTARTVSGEWLFLDAPTWCAADHQAAENGDGPCPVCHGRKLAVAECCLGCTATGLDGRVQFPGTPVGLKIDYSVPVEGPKYQPQRGLAGGRGKAAGAAPGHARV